MVKINTMKEFEQWISNTEHFYLYGAGNICNEIIHKLKKMNAVSKTDYILVTELMTEHDSLQTIEIVKFDKENLNQDIPILVAVSSIYKGEIEAKLQKENWDNYVLLSDYLVPWLNKEDKWYVIQSLKEQIVSDSKECKQEEDKKDILFLSPPYWDAYSPFSAVPCLVAKLKSEGFSVGQYDIGIHCTHYLIKNNWKRVAEEYLSHQYYEEQISIYEKNLYSSYEDYRKDLWFLEGEYFDATAIKQEYVGFNAVQKRIIDSFYSRIYAMDITSIDFDNCESIEYVIKTTDSQTLLEVLHSSELMSIFYNIPSVVGISITSTAQFIPGCILAELLKKCRPDVKIILGGSCVDLFVKSTYAPKRDVNKFFDYIIIGEGETAITSLMRYLQGEGRLDEVPNLVFIESDTDIRYSKSIIENVDELPVPDYDGLNLELYLAPKLVLPYQASRGCHYGNCAFCNHDEKYRHNYRSKRVDKVIEDLLLLSKKYNTHYFQFVDEAIRPDRFREIVNEMDKYEEFKSFKWMFYSRVSRQYDEELLNKAYRNGCEMVMFGVESFNQRLLNFIKKGINAEVSKYCLEVFSKCKIKTYAWLMCNLPSETVEEAKEDLREVKRLKKYIDEFCVSMFFLSRNTDMYEAQEEYNILSVDPKDPTRFQSHNDGVQIDNDEMAKFYVNEYAKYQRKTCLNGNRYTLFFE